ncbi:MAG: YIP1 family protein [Chlamydiales bacterium]|nr:YIP1 family protein [Chlamydiales bacterium]
MAKQMSSSPWVKMWTKPRETIRSIVSIDPNYQIWWLAAVYGFPMLLNMSQNMSFAASIPLLMILLIAAIFCAPIGMLGFMITSALVHWTGKWLGGVGTFQQIRAAIAWSNVTNLATSALWLLLVLVFGTDVFFKTFPQLPFEGASLAVVTIIFLLQTVLSIWSFVLLFQSLAEIQKFSVWRAILNIILPFVIVTIALWAVFVFVCWAIGMKS